MRRRSAWLIAAVVAISSVAAGAGPTALKIGEKAPSFTLEDPAGKAHSMDRYLESKYLVIMFISTQCPVSNDYNERMARLNKQYEGKVAFLAINSNKAETPEQIAEHARKHEFDFTVLKDVDNVVADLYGASVTPETYVVDGNGILRYHGRIDDSRDPDDITTHDLQITLDALLAGKDVPRTQTKAFGCGIKRVKKDR